MLQAILFDLWETLITDPLERSLPRQAWRSANVHRILREHGIDIEPPRISAALSEASRTLTAYHDDGRDDGPAGRVDLFLRHLESAEAHTLGMAPRHDLEAAITSMAPDSAPLAMDGAPETLAAARSLGLKTGLVSNAGLTTAPHLRRLIGHYGLAPHLDALVFSDELALAKPDGRVFGAALDQIGVDAASAVFVGDSPHNDVFGAQRHGLRAVQIGSRTVDGIVPDARIERLPDLLPALHALRLLDSTAVIA